jgi:antitoxin YefM
MKTITATDARSNLFNLIKKIIGGHMPARIAHREGNAILIAEEDYESLLETAELLSVPGLASSIKKADRDIKKGDLFTLDQVFKDCE